MHVSLPKELEDMIIKRVESGDYGSASELVHAALCDFFQISDESTIGPEDLNTIRKVIGPRLAALEDGTADLLDFNEAFDEIERKHFQ